MSIEKKSLISTLKTTKKANAASSAGPEAAHVMSKNRSKVVSKVQSKVVSKMQSKVVSKRALDRA
jgi:hypothetical protein